MSTETRDGAAALVVLLPFSDTYIADLETLLAAAKKVQSARDAVSDYDALAKRRAAALDQNLEDALTRFIETRDAVSRRGAP
jgi:hypothetical protein